MGGLTGAVQWWEESQLRVLVLTSMVIQFFLYFFPYFRRWAIPGWFRFILWLAYHAGDAVAIYALAMLFNRHKVDQGDGGVGGGSSSNTLLEVVWAPILLIHLGGSDGVTAYNIEDNELWTRHLLTAASQVTVAVYVFCKSWPPGGDKKLLQTAILLFVIGVGKCFFKSWAFKKASNYSRVSSRFSSVPVFLEGSSVPVMKQQNDVNKYYKLEEYVKVAREIVVPPEDHQVMEDPGEPGTVTTTSLIRVVEVIKKRTISLLFRLRGLLSSKSEAAKGTSNHPRSRRLRGEALLEERGEVFNLFVDLSSPYPNRISILYNFMGLREDTAYDLFVRGGLASAFLLLYTKFRTSLPDEGGKNEGGNTVGKEKMREVTKKNKNTGNKFGAMDVIRVCILLSRWARVCILLSRWALPWASIGLFHQSHKEAYNAIDVKVTYALLCCTAVLETYSRTLVGVGTINFVPNPGQEAKHKGLFWEQVWPETIAQYSLVGYFVRNKKHSIEMRIVSLLQCKEFLDQHWCMEPCFSSARITNLVLRYLKDGWKQEIEDAASYRSFNNHNSQWVLDMNRPFDECVLLWHLATDFCFFSASFPDHRCASAEPPITSRLQCRQQESTVCKAVQCRQMSNYMVYLLFVNPEMLLPGSRRNLFETAYDELKGILKDWEWNPVCWSQCKPCGVKLMKEEENVMDKLKTVMQEESERSSQEAFLSMEGSNKDDNFIHQAWALAQSLLQMDEMERWKKIQDVWVQMLCFAASRCRGYLHAKALGKGGEFLSYVWLLLFHMGMETFSERLQRELLPSSQGTTPPTSEVSTTGAGNPSASTVHIHASTGTTPSTSEIRMAEDDDMV